MGAVERVRELVEPIVVQDGVELYDVEHESGVLRIMVDRPGGVDVDTIGDVSQHISQALDVDDPFPNSRYLLEVSSPGIERRLRLASHFQSQIGSDISIKVKTGVEGDRRFNARLIAADEKTIEVADVDPSATETRKLKYSDIESARTIFHWGEQTNGPSKASASKSSKAAKGKVAKTKSMKSQATVQLAEATDASQSAADSQTATAAANGDGSTTTNKKVSAR